jgi:Spy/CpxP family protein refolding chaperone
VNKWIKMATGVVAGGALLLCVTTAALAADPSTAPRGQGGWQEGPMMRGPQWGGNFGPRSSHKALTELSGMTDEQIDAERETGKSLAQIAASNGVRESVLIEALLASRKELLDARAKAGTMTQEQANTAYKFAEQRIKERRW